jgi:arginyl-tRNA synthetase
MGFMADPVVCFAAAFQAVFDRYEYGADPVVRPSDRADYQVNGVLPLAKKLGRNPRELAEEMLASVDIATFADATIAGPGFINLVLRDQFLAEQVAELLTDDQLGVRRVEAPERVLIDYSGPNVAKEMHVGHLRSSILGDSLVRLLEFVGHTVIRQNHVGDWGLAFGMLIEHLRDLQSQTSAEGLSIRDLGAFYKQSREKFEASDEYKERSRNRVVALQSGDVETLALWKILVDQSTIYFQHVYEKLGLRLCPQDVVGESFYNPMLDAVVKDLEAEGLLQESDGAQCVFPPGFLGREGEPQPLIVQNRNGGFGYATTDLAAVRDRVDRLGATWLLYVVGAPQAMHLSMVWKVAELAGWMSLPVRAHHVAFGSVLGEDRKMYRTRAGESIRLVDLLDEAVRRALAELETRANDFDAAQRQSIAEAVGIGAVKYADLCNDRVKDYVFDWNRMLAFEGNTAPYLQYACARIASILRKSDGGLEDTASVRLGSPQERALALVLLQFDVAVHESIERLGPHRLCTYLFDLAQKFTSFYDACPVLRSDVDPDDRVSRLLLCELTLRVLRQGLSLLGISVPDRM